MYAFTTCCFMLPSHAAGLVSWLTIDPLSWYVSLRNEKENLSTMFQFGGRSFGDAVWIRRRHRGMIMLKDLLLVVLRCFRMSCFAESTRLRC